MARRRLAEARCRSCGKPILRGLDSDLCGLLVDVDPLMIDSMGEMLAILAERGTYRLDGDRIERRAAWSIRAVPADEESIVVLAEHRCHSEVTGAPLPILPPRVPMEGWLDDDPPF